MNVYLVIIEDRHTDTDVSVFRELTDAQEFMKEFLADFDKSDVGYEELTPRAKKDGWISYATYSTESDSVRIVERIVL